MTIQLAPETEALIREQLESGGYGSADAVIAAAVRLLAERDHALQSLRTKIQAGLDSGESVELTPELMDQIEREAEVAFLRGDEPDPDVCP